LNLQEIAHSLGQVGVSSKNIKELIEISDILTAICGLTQQDILSRLCSGICNQDIEMLDDIGLDCEYIKADYKRELFVGRFPQVAWNFVVIREARRQAKRVTIAFPYIVSLGNGIGRLEYSSDGKTEYSSQEPKKFATSEPESKPLLEKIITL